MFKELAEKLGVTFSNPDLLQQAVTHRSYLNEHREYKLDHNERLEFLGDAVLELVVTEYLYRNYPNPEGELTSWRAALVNGEMLALIAQDLGVEEFLLMSRGEAKDTGRARQYLLANAFEAILGAVYLDQGFDVSSKVVQELVITRLPNVLSQCLYKDPKSLFQELSQEQKNITPNYRLISEEGPDHDKKFVVGAYIGDELISKGDGPSKQDAQRDAAKKALEAKGW